MPYSPRKQGAGLMSINDAVNTRGYLSVEGMERPKLELKDDPAMKGEVLRQDIEVPWCGPYEDGKNCTLTDFELRVRDVLRPECVRER